MIESKAVKQQPMIESKATKQQPKKAFEELLTPHPDLAVKLREAIESGMFFVTVSYLRSEPGNPNDLHHFYRQSGYPTADVGATLAHLAADFAAKETPTAAIEGDGMY